MKIQIKLYKVAALQVNLEERDLKDRNLQQNIKFNLRIKKSNRLVSEMKCHYRYKAIRDRLMIHCF